MCLVSLFSMQVCAYVLLVFFFRGQPFISLPGSVVIVVSLHPTSKILPAFYGLIRAVGLP